MVDPIEMSSAQRLAGFAELFARHYEVVFRAALRVTGRPVDAEDVLQTVFLRVLSQSDWDQVRQAAYFKRAAVNAAVDLLRRRVVRAETAYDDLAPHAAVEPALLLKERLRRAIATLDVDDATLFLLVMSRDCRIRNWPMCSNSKRTTSPSGCTAFACDCRRRWRDRRRP
jgi:RNA polymerase sigma factor (sigma-70 family)